MAQGKQDKGQDEATTMFVERLLDEAQNIADEAGELDKRRNANRDMLRGLVAQGLTTDEQAELIQGEPERDEKGRAKADTGGFYPLRTRKSDDDTATTAAAA